MLTQDRYRAILDLLEEKNYGDCSMVFSVVGVYLS